MVPVLVLTFAQPFTSLAGVIRRAFSLYVPGSRPGIVSRDSHEPRISAGRTQKLRLTPQRKAFAVRHRLRLDSLARAFAHFVVKLFIAKPFSFVADLSQEGRFRQSPGRKLPTPARLNRRYAWTPWTGFLFVQMDAAEGQRPALHKQPPALYQNGLDRGCCRGLSTSPVFRKTVLRGFTATPWSRQATRDSHARSPAYKKVYRIERWDYSTGMGVLRYRGSTHRAGLLQRASVEPREPVSRYVAPRIDTWRLVSLAARNRPSNGSRHLSEIGGLVYRVCRPSGKRRHSMIDALGRTISRHRRNVTYGVNVRQPDFRVVCCRILSADRTGHSR